MQIRHPHFLQGDRPASPRFTLFSTWIHSPPASRHWKWTAGGSDLSQHYSYIQQLGYPTLPECFHRASEHQGSCCHSWSGAAAIYATSYVLGLRQAEPGNPDRWILAPVVHSHRQAEGVLPHPRGPIRARWERHDDVFRARIEAPEGITVEAGPGVVWDHSPA